MEPLRRFDQKLTKFIQSWPSSWEALMSGASFLGGPIVVLAIGFAGFLSAVHHGQTQIQRAFALGAVAYGLNTVLKQLLHRRRPHGLKVTMLGMRSYSFPSGHAFGTVIFYGLFSYIDLVYLAQPWGYLIAVLLWSLILLIGISRVYLRAHYPSDVAAGWLLGLVSLVIALVLAF